MASINLYKRKPHGRFNRHQRNFSDLKTKMNNPAPPKENYGIFNNPELLHLLCRAVMGTIVEVTTVNNEKLFGLVKCASPAGGFGIELSHGSLYQKKHSNLLLLEAKDIKSMVMRDVNLQDCFKNEVPTDQEIVNKIQTENGDSKSNTLLSGKPGVLKLQPFFQNESQINDKMALSSHESPTNSESSPVIPEESLEDSAVEKKGDHWFPPQDMFSVNQEKYQVSSSYQEDMEQYTIKIDTTSSDYSEKYSRAEQLANEIEKDSESTRAAELENCNDDDEEKLFGAVDGDQVDNLNVNDNDGEYDDSFSSDKAENQQSRKNHETVNQTSSSPSDSEQNKKLDEQDDEDNDNTSSISVDFNTQTPAHLNPEAPAFLPPPTTSAYPHPGIFPPHLMRPPLLPHNPGAPMMYPAAAIPVDPQHPVQPFGPFVLSGGPYPYSYDPLQCMPVGAQQYMYPPSGIPYAYYAAPGLMSPRGVPVTAPAMIPHHHPAMMYPPHIYHQMTHPMIPTHHPNQRPTSSTASTLPNTSHSNNYHSSNNHQSTTNTSTSP